MSVSMESIPQNRGDFLEWLKKQSEQTETAEDLFWVNLCDWTEAGQVIPLISGSLMYDLIFNPSQAGCENHQDNEPLPKKTVMNMIAERWAQRIGYRFPDKQELARVAQYMRSTDPAPIIPKDGYLRLIKQMLLFNAAERRPDRSREILQLMNGLRNYSFSDLAVRELGLISFGPECSDPLSILARLPLPIYITTSYHDLLELALESMGKKPITQVCIWTGDVNQFKPEHQPLKALEPSVQSPLVYHLFGMERYPFSLVLTEDDYLDFLVKITETRKDQNPVVPNTLRAMMASSSLLLLGYRLQEWDFRTLFRGLIIARDSSTAPYGNTIIQLSMENQYDHPENEEIHKFFSSAQSYLQEYFKKISFEIRWGDPGCFLTELDRRWQGRQA